MVINVLRCQPKLFLVYFSKITQIGLSFYQMSWILAVFNLEGVSGETVLRVLFAIVSIVVSSIMFD